MQATRLPTPAGGCVSSDPPETRWIYEAVRANHEAREAWAAQVNARQRVTVPYEHALTEGEVARMLELSRFEWRRGR